jgi:lipopolysaccharide/colanic/teichoic acid biosynthesis glycosyltransferase
MLDRATTPTDSGGWERRDQLLAAAPGKQLLTPNPHLKAVSLARRSVLFELDEPLTRGCFMEAGVVSLVATALSRVTSSVAMVGREGVVGVATRVLGGNTALRRSRAPGLGGDYLPNLLGPRAGAAAGMPNAADASDRPYFRLRRLLDVALSAAAMLALFPFLAAVAILVLLDDGRPILFRQARPGRDMRVFTLYKFRTMRVAFALDGTPVDDDTRTSTLGRLLRRTRLDELPQLFNVLVGDMSFIGPRPLLPCDLPDNASARATIRPGITGWAQVNGGRRLNATEKMALDTWYIRHANAAIDARIVWMTVRMILFGDRIDHREILRATATSTLAPSRQHPAKLSRGRAAARSLLGRNSSLGSG